MKEKLDAARVNKSILGDHTPFISGDLLHFHSELQYRENATGEAIRWYLPPMIAILETFYKVLFSKYLDSSDTHLARAKELHSRYKPDFSFEILFGLNQKQFSIGEIYAHSLKYNRLDEIRNNYQIICDCDYVDKIKRFDAGILKGSDLDEAKAAQGDVERIMSSVSRAFILRHSLIHEYPAKNVVVQKEEMLTYLNDARLLTMITDRMFWAETKSPNPFPHDGYGYKS